MFDFSEDKYAQEAIEIDDVFNQFSWDFNSLQSSESEDKDKLYLVDNFEYPKEIIFKSIYKLKNIFLNKPQSLPYLIVDNNIVDENELKVLEEK